MSSQALIRKPLENEEMVVTLDDAIKIGEIVAASKMFPEIQDKARAVVAILAGRELGIPPMASLRGIHVIKGKVELGAGLLAAMIRKSRRYDYKVLQAWDHLCELIWYDNGEEIGRSHFTIDDAKRAKLIKPDSNWEKFPKAMLFARALSAGQKLYAPDVGFGAVYAPGEIPEDEPAEINITPERPMVVSPDNPIPTAKEIFEDARPLPDAPLPEAWTDNTIAREIADQEIANTIGAELKSIHDEIVAEAPAPAPQVEALMPERIAEAREKNMPPPPQPPKPPDPPRPRRDLRKFHQKNRNHSPEYAERFDRVVATLTANGITGAELLAEANAVLEGMGAPQVFTRYEINDAGVELVCEAFEAWAEKLKLKAAEQKAEPAKQ